MTTGGPGVAALPDGGRVDFARLRAERRDRMFAAMAAEGVDALVLGRPGHVAYASGARQLWTAGARPFGPAGVAVGSTGRVHLLSTWDEGVPSSVGHEDLFGLSWNPAIVASRLKSIPGLSGARTVACDGYSLGMAALLASACPGSTLVDARAVLERALLPRTEDELACIAVAASVAETAMSALIAALRPGVSERQLVAVYLAAVAGVGCPTPPSEGVVCALPRSGAGALRRLATDRTVGVGELVVFNPGAFYGGYLATLGRTWLAGHVAPTADQRRLGQRCRAALDAVISACRAGARGADLVVAWDATGEAAPPEPIAFGVGLGAEAPLIGHGVGGDVVLAAGSVLAVQSWVAGEVAGGFYEQELVLVTDGEPAVLTRYGRGPFGQGTGA